MAVIGDYLSMKVNMGGSTGQVLSKARDYRKEKFGKLQAHTERQTNQLAKTAEANVAGAMDNTFGAAGREIKKGMDILTGSGGGGGSGGSDSSSANYTSKTNKSSQGSGKKADLSKDKKKKTGGKASLYAKK